MSAVHPQAVRFEPHERIVTARTTRLTGAKLLLPQRFDLTPALVAAGYVVPRAILARENYAAPPVVFRKRERRA